MSEENDPVTVSHAIAGFRFRSLTGTEEISQPFRYHVELLHEQATIAGDDVLGSNLTISLAVSGSSGDRSDGVRHFNGVVTEFSLRGTLGDHALYALTLRPWLALLEQRVNCRILKGNAIEIVQAVLKDHDLAPDVDVLALGDLPQYEFVVQYRESDLNFVLRTLERDGIYFYFVHQERAHSLILTDNAHHRVKGYEWIRYHPPDATANEFAEQVSDWRSYHVITAGRLAVTDYNFKAPRAKLGTTAEASADYLYGNLEVFEFPGGYSDHAQGAAIARRRLEALQVSRSRFEGSGNVRAFSAGQAFTLEDHPNEAFNREYLVQSLHVHLESNALQSGPAREGRGLLRSSIVAHDLASPFQPALRTAKPVMNGIQTATVVGTAGNTVETDGENYGSVKVKFPWDRSADKVGANSCWVRVSQAWAGTGSGAVFPPRIGQEVLVAFLEGDPDRPIVVGRVSNNDNMHPYGGSQTRSGIRSHTFGGGPENFNELRFDDEKGREELFIQAEKTMTTLVKGDQDVTVKGASVLRVNEEMQAYAKAHTVHIDEKQVLQAKEQEFIADVIQIFQSPQTKAQLKEEVFEISAGTKVQLRVGDTVIEMDGTSITITSNSGTGTVDIKGMPINLNC